MEERISEIEDQFNEIKCEDKVREKRIKKNEQSFQEYETVKRPNLCLIGVAGKHSSGYYPGELPQPRKVCQHSNLGNTENTTKAFL